MTGFIASQIARINRNFLLVALGLALGAAVVVWLGQYEILGVVRGPRLVTAQELASARFQSDPGSYKIIVQVSGSEVRSSFYRETVRRGKSSATLYCGLLKLETGQLIVEDWKPLASMTVAGKVKEPAQHIWRAARAYQKAGDILPVLLDARDWKSDGWMLVGISGAAALAALAIAGVLLYWSSNPDRHPVRRAVLRLGDFESTAMQMEGEMQAELQRFGAVHLGQVMVIHTPTFSFDAVRLSDLTSARTEWVQKGKSRALYLMMDTRDGRNVKWQIQRKGSEELLQSIRSAAHLEQSAELS